MSHNHCHGHHDHDHSDAEEVGIQYNLYQKIDKENLQCLNESVEGSGKTVFKPWDKRLDRVHVSVIVTKYIHLSAVFIIYSYYNRFRETGSRNYYL